jgi:uncharacterized phage protein gp47/JayE
MPWVTPTLEQLRSMNRSNVQAQLRSGPMIPNSVLRVMADSNAGLAYLVLLYINWLALQLMPDTAEEAYLDRFGNIWKPGGQGRKTATFATGVIQFTGLGSITMPAGSIMTGANDVTTGVAINFVTATPTLIGVSATNVSITAITPGATGLVIGSQLQLQTGISGINGTGAISAITDGIEQETDDELRARVLDRIQEPPVGGDAEDFVAWAKATPGVNVTRAWCSPLEMGIGTVTVRFMTDDLINNIVGFPTAASITSVTNYIDSVRPVAIKDRWVFAPIPEPISFSISNLTPDSVAIRNGIAASVALMLYNEAAPAHAINGVEQPATTIYASMVSDAIMSVSGVVSFTLGMTDHKMPNQACLAILGTIVYA